MIPPASSVRSPLPLSLPPTRDAAPPWSLARTVTSAVDGLAALARSTLATAAQASAHRDDDVDRYMTGGAYDLALERVVAVAQRAIGARVAALHAGAEASGDPTPVPVVVFDIDDTLLSTHPRRRLESGATADAWPRAVGDHDAPLPPLGPVVRLHQQLLADGVRTVIITGRWASNKDATLANLYWAGVGGWDHALFRTVDSSDALLSARGYKERQRARLVAAGYQIVGIIGDQHSDMAYGAPGVVNVKLPNPLYTVY
ncbi:Haloacid dehydrogenase [Pandoravirus dulcis]|uniref:Haloacid dehydrogenase n=1 Tax=Pandoravirus dulcis TaxID=1349409 RepID=S4VRF8_9VIRU|nr:Haloacid dehydrogenase [Pandoravirus dulcis]AGO81950.1 Haloacid dehydrogenase [Pandoravirus dulcis]